MHCLADAGNILDCACLAGIVAFKHFRRPEVEVIGDDVTVVRISPLVPRNMVSRIELNTCFVIIACARGARPCTTRYSPHAILRHICFLPRSDDASCRRSLVAGTKAECWNNEYRTQRAARDMCLTQSRRRANGTGRDSAAAQRCCRYREGFGQVSRSTVTRRLGTTQSRGTINFSIKK